MIHKVTLGCSGQRGSQDLGELASDDYLTFGALIWGRGLTTFMCLYLRRSLVLLVGWWSILILESFFIFSCILRGGIFTVNIYFYVAGICRSFHYFYTFGCIQISSTKTLFICFIYEQRLCIINLCSFIYEFNCDVKTYRFPSNTFILLYLIYKKTKKLMRYFANLEIEIKSK